jgi:thiamine biosynthesis lipoprotein
MLTGRCSSNQDGGSDLADSPPIWGGGVAFAAVRSVGVFSIALVLACCGSGDSDIAHELRLTGEALGTMWSVELVMPESPAPEGVAEIRERVASTLERVDRGMSTWREDAELARFNRQADLEPFAFSPETRRVIVAAMDLARETGGAFDPTVAPLVALWGFGAQAADVPPSVAELEQARRRVGWRKLEWRPGGRLARRVAGVQLDLSAIAKGYAVDAVVAELASDRPIAALVEVGGEVRALGAKPGGVPWRVGIDDPDAPGSRLSAVVRLTGGALATSGDYRRVRVIEGRRLTHVVDPRSGRPVEQKVASASVIAPTCMEADAVATALMVLGPDEGLAWVEDRPWLEVLLMVREGERTVERRASTGWERWLAPER